MPKLSMETPHELGQEEATHRLKHGFSFVKSNFQNHLSDVTEQWEKGIGILRQAEQIYQGDPTIAERIRLFQSYIDNGGKRTPVQRDTVLAGQ